MRTLLLVIVSLILINCGSSQSSISNSSRAEFVPLVGGSGYTCFLIRDENGKAVGGNCVKD